MVSFPGNIPFQSDWTARDYLNKAGASPRSGQGRDARIRASTGEWVSHEAKTSKPGHDLVPEKRDRDWWHSSKTRSRDDPIVTIYLSSIGED